MAFHVGKIVVCVDGEQRNPLWRGQHHVVTGAVYTIRDIYIAGRTGEVAIRVEEIVNPVVDFPWGPSEPSFRPSRFRPVRTTSIDTFTKLLKPVSEKETA